MAWSRTWSIWTRGKETLAFYSLGVPKQPEPEGTPPLPWLRNLNKQAGCCSWGVGLRGVGADVSSTLCWEGWAHLGLCSCCSFCSAFGGGRRRAGMSASFCLIFRLAWGAVRACDRSESCTSHGDVARTRGICSSCALTRSVQVTVTVVRSAYYLVTCLYFPILHITACSFLRKGKIKSIKRNLVCLGSCRLKAVNIFLIES